MKRVSGGNASKDQLEVRNTIQQYLPTYQLLPVDWSRLHDNVLGYVAKQIFVNYQNIVLRHHEKMLKKTFDVLFGTKEFWKVVEAIDWKKIKKEEEETKKSIRIELNGILSDCLKRENFSGRLRRLRRLITPLGMNWRLYLNQLQKALPKMTNSNGLKRGNYIYDVKANLNVYFKEMLQMQDILEMNGFQRMHMYPQSKTLIPGFVRFDSTSINRLINAKGLETKFKGNFIFV